MNWTVFIWTLIHILAPQYISIYHDYYHAGLGEMCMSIRHHQIQLQRHGRVTALESAPRTTPSVAFCVTSYSLEIGSNFCLWTRYSLDSCLFDTPLHWESTALYLISIQSTIHRRKEFALEYVDRRLKPSSMFREYNVRASPLISRIQWQLLLFLPLFYITILLALPAVQHALRVGKFKYVH